MNGEPKVTNKDLPPTDALHALGLIHPIATAIIDEQLIVIQTSSNFNQMLGFSNDRFEGIILSDVLWEFVGIEDEVKALYQGKTERLTLENINRQMPDGSNHYFSFHIMVNLEQTIKQTLLLIVEDRSDVGRLQQSLMQDRNELRLARQELSNLNEELTQLNRLKSLLLSIAAHDLRTPLASIHGYAELLRDDLAESETARRHLVDIILSQSYRQQQLINDLLDLDQIERGEMAIVLQECLIGEIIDEVVTSILPLSDRTNVAVGVTLPEEPLRILVDPQRLSQILYNLLGNALKFTPVGGHIKLIARNEDDSLFIDVIDDGNGMSEAVIADLFEPYFSKRMNRERDTGSGTGLGLFIVKTIVEAHNGQIRVDSKLGEGTTFSIVLPTSPRNGVL